MQNQNTTSAKQFGDVTIDSSSPLQGSKLYYTGSTYLIIKLNSTSGGTLKLKYYNQYSSSTGITKVEWLLIDGPMGGYTSESV